MTASPPRLLLLDLDETLLPTGDLQAVRHSGVPTTLAKHPGYEGLRLHAGLGDVLRVLSSHVLLGVVSSSPRWYVEQILGDHLPDLVLWPIVTYDEVTRLKPDPEPLQVALAAADVDTADAWYVGDVLEDWEACARIGMTFLAAGWASTVPFPPQVRVLASPADLLSLMGAVA